MGGACSCGTKVAADDQSTKDRLGAPNLPRSAPARVRHSGTDGKVLPCAVRQSGADNPLVHSLSTAQLLEIHEAFSKFGAHPASTADLRAAGYTEGAEAEVLVGSDRSDSCGTRSPQPCAEGRPWTEWWALQPPTRWLASPVVDRDGDGHIEAKELATVMRIMGMEPSDQQLQELIKSVDVDGNGKVSRDSRAVLSSRPPAFPHRLPLVPCSRGACASCPRCSCTVAAWSAARPSFAQIELEEFSNLMARRILMHDGKVGCLATVPCRGPPCCGCAPFPPCLSPLRARVRALRARRGARTASASASLSCKMLPDGRAPPPAFLFARWRTRAGVGRSWLCALLAFAAAAPSLLRTGGAGTGLQAVRRRPERLRHGRRDSIAHVPCWWRRGANGGGGRGADQNG
mgnify:CR=1 FL=1